VAAVATYFIHSTHGRVNPISFSDEILPFLSGFFLSSIESRGKKREYKFFDEIRALLIVCVEREKKMRSCGTLPSSRLLKKPNKISLFFSYTQPEEMSMLNDIFSIHKKEKKKMSV
jgi:hypothetical protein